MIFIKRKCFSRHTVAKKIVKFSAMIFKKGFIFVANFYQLQLFVKVQ